MKHFFLLFLNLIICGFLFYYAYKRDANSQDALDFFFWLPSIVLLIGVFLLNWIFYLQLKKQENSIANTLKINAFVSLAITFYAFFLALFGV